MLDFMKSFWYRLFIFVVIMPMCGYIFSYNPVLGAVLALCQVPWFINAHYSQGD